MRLNKSVHFSEKKNPLLLLKCHFLEIFMPVNLHARDSLKDKDISVSTTLRNSPGKTEFPDADKIILATAWLYETWYSI
jgi:hypothetical protein